MNRFFFVQVYFELVNKLKLLYLLRSHDASSNAIFILSSESFWKAKSTADVIALFAPQLTDVKQTHIATNTCISIMGHN